MSTQEFRAELEHIRRVSDMLVTGHANLRDRYNRRATLLDLAVMALSTWLTAVVFIEPRINVKLIPFGIDPQIWVGFLGIFTFFLSIVQLRVDWKGRADAHKRSFDLYSEVKRECDTSCLAGDADGRQLPARSFAVRPSDGGRERLFRRASSWHRREITSGKVEIGEHLDKHPSASILLVRISSGGATTCAKGRRGDNSSFDPRLAYHMAKEHVLAGGFAAEVSWQRERDFGAF